MMTNHQSIAGCVKERASVRANYATKQVPWKEAAFLEIIRFAFRLWLVPNGPVSRQLAANGDISSASPRRVAKQRIPLLFFQARVDQLKIVLNFKFLFHNSEVETFGRGVGLRSVKFDKEVPHGKDALHVAEKRRSCVRDVTA